MIPKLNTTFVIKNIINFTNHYIMDNQPQPQNPDNTNNSTQDTSGQTVTIEIIRHRQLFNILRSPRALWKFIGILIVIVILLFFILAAVSLIIKRYYPYNDLNTNIYGATTLKNEDKDVTYWLFNTAEMWANSGIKVQTNDIITIRTSGAWHSSIHHLVEDAKSNNILRDNWIGSDGGMQKSTNDDFRAQFRISPQHPYGILLMGVVSENSQNTHSSGTPDENTGYTEEFIKAIDNPNNPDNPSIKIYPIGRERANIRILSDGILHFTVNDIILTRKNITNMYKAYFDSIKQAFEPAEVTKIEDWIKTLDTGKELQLNTIESLDKPYTYANGHYHINSNDSIKSDILFGRYAGQDSALYLLKNELIYYYEKKFYDAWFVDNIGSALVIIERKNQNQQ